MKLMAVADVGTWLQGDLSREFSDVCYDSRRVSGGSLFVAVPGYREDGHLYVDEAVQRGAVAVAVERPVSVPPTVALMQVPSSRAALAALAGRFYSHPDRRLRLIGVTGTNGKTTTAHLIREVLGTRWGRVGLIGTVHNRIGDEILPAHHTTPEAPDVYRYLAAMVTAGSRHAVMEVSSHALELQRVAGVEYDVGVFTNLTRDHLDFHGDFRHYREAKLRLFRGLSGPGAKDGPRVGVLNADDPAFRSFRRACAAPVITYGLHRGADVQARAVELTLRSARFVAVTGSGEVEVRLPLPGKFNVYNALAALTVGWHEGCDLAEMARALAATSGVAGRLEAVELGQPFGLFVDYAHTPDGLANVLAAVRGACQGRVILVFGAGGDRDRGKRRKMGAVAARLADVAIVTSDNPRSEEPLAIIDEIVAGIHEATPGAQRWEVIADRLLAIDRAVALAQEGDAVIVAGKGHETYQIIGDRVIPFDDREVARARILARLQREKGESA